MPPYSNIILIQPPTAHNVLRDHGFSRYFFVFCVVEEILLVVTGDSVILGLIVSYVISM